MTTRGHAAVAGSVVSETSASRPASVFGVARYVLGASAALSILYGLRIALAVEDETIWRYWFLKERGLLERAEAIVWIPAVVLNVGIFVRLLRRSAPWIALAWFGFLSALTIFALGEEVSWGQYVVGIQPGEWMLENNVQKDMSLHNLDLTRFAGLPADSSFTAAVKFTLNAAPYLLCIALWIGLPLLRRVTRWRLFDALALPSDSIVVFFAANVVVYVLIDQLVADVAEMFELVIAMVFSLAAYDAHRRLVAGQRLGPE
jgi:hypothetical protein